MSAQQEIDAGSRFQFGANWAQFLSELNEDRIAAAESSLKEMLDVAHLKGQRFLDIGSGSGLFSLAARRLGAKVHSFDFDAQSVACTEELKRRYFPGDTQWRIEKGSALDRGYLESLGKFNVVYSWGVLHHTGAMWLGIENAICCVSMGDGKLWVALYNDQGWKSHFWWFVKFFYNKLPGILRRPYVMMLMAVTYLAAIIKYTIKLKPMTAIRPLLRDRSARGMSTKFDRVDWIGGFPYEFTTFETFADYMESRGFLVMKSIRNRSFGCSQWVLKRRACVD